MCSRDLLLGMRLALMKGLYSAVHPLKLFIQNMHPNFCTILSKLKAYRGLLMTPMNVYAKKTGNENQIGLFCECLTMTIK